MFSNSGTTCILWYGSTTVRTPRLLCVRGGSAAAAAHHEASSHVPWWWTGAAAHQTSQDIQLWRLCNGYQIFLSWAVLPVAPPSNQRAAGRLGRPPLPQTNILLFLIQNPALVWLRSRKRKHTIIITLALLIIIFTSNKRPGSKVLATATMQRIMGSSVSTWICPGAAVLEFRRTIYSKPPKNKIGAGVSARTHTHTYIARQRLTTAQTQAQPAAWERGIHNFLAAKFMKKTWSKSGTRNGAITRSGERSWCEYRTRSGTCTRSI